MISRELLYVRFGVLTLMWTLTAIFTADFAANFGWTELQIGHVIAAIVVSTLLTAMTAVAYVKRF